MTSCVPPPDRFAVAVNCSPVPPRVNAVFPFGAVTVMLVAVLLLTFSVVLAVWFPDLAVMVELPALAPAVAKPELLIVATFAADEVQVTEEETSFVLLSPKVPVAVNCWVLLG